MNDPARLFIALYTDEDITSESAPSASAALKRRALQKWACFELTIHINWPMPQNTV